MCSIEVYLIWTFQVIFHLEVSFTDSVSHKMIAQNIFRHLDSAYLALQSVFWKTFKCPQHNEKSAKVFLWDYATFYNCDISYLK